MKAFSLLTVALISAVIFFGSLPKEITTLAQNNITVSCHELAGSVKLSDRQLNFCDRNGVTALLSYYENNTSFNARRIQEGYQSLINKKLAAQQRVQVSQEEETFVSPIASASAQTPQNEQPTEEEAIEALTVLQAYLKQNSGDIEQAREIFENLMKEATKELDESKVILSNERDVRIRGVFSEVIDATEQVLSQLLYYVNAFVPQLQELTTTRIYVEQSQEDRENKDRIQDEATGRLHQFLNRPKGGEGQ